VVQKCLVRTMKSIKQYKKFEELPDEKNVLKNVLYMYILQE